MTAAMTSAVGAAYLQHTADVNERAERCKLGMLWEYFESLT